MKSKKAQAKKKKMAPTQQYLPIAEIKENCVLLKDGTLRAVLMVGSINFSLKSEDEQNATISGYVGFLNSIDFPIQVVVQSRRLQIKPYLQRLIDAERQQPNELLRVQIADYRSFVEELVQIGQIMTKRFYVIVPYDPISNKKKSFFSRIKEVWKPITTLRVKGEYFQKRKRELDLRVRQVTDGLSSVGLEVAQLDTQSLIELYYSTYNPDISFAEGLQPIEQLQVEQI